MTEGSAYIIDQIASIKRGAKLLGAFAHRSKLAPRGSISVVCEFDTGQRMFVIVDCACIAGDANLQEQVESHVQSMVSMELIKREARHHG